MQTQNFTDPMDPDPEHWSLWKLASQQLIRIREHLLSKWWLVENRKKNVQHFMLFKTTEKNRTVCNTVEEHKAWKGQLRKMVFMTVQTYLAKWSRIQKVFDRCWKVTGIGKCFIYRCFRRLSNQHYAVFCKAKLLQYSNSFAWNIKPLMSSATLEALCKRTFLRRSKRQAFL